LRVKAGCRLAVQRRIRILGLTGSYGAGGIMTKTRGWVSRGGLDVPSLSGGLGLQASHRGRGQIRERQRSPRNHSFPKDLSDNHDSRGRQTCRFLSRYFFHHPQLTYFGVSQPSIIWLCGWRLATLPVFGVGGSLSPSLIL